MDSPKLSSSNPDPAGYLLNIGNRIKSLRALRGMSRRLLAQRSGVSERYLAELENGKGNISILRLRDVADAMGIAADDLIAEPRTRSPEYSFLLQYIREAEPIELARLSRVISTRRDRQSCLVALIGLRGAGKSTLGDAVARELAVPFVELVRAIEERAGIAVNEIFSLGGQAAYRRFERQCLNEVIESGQPSVLSVGGSLVSEPASYEQLLASCVTIWVRAAPEDHMSRVVAQGDKRPMADSPRAMDDLKRILAERESLCRRANYTVETSGRSIAECVNEILNFKEVSEITQNRGTI